MNSSTRLYTASVLTKGGREGASRSSDGNLDIKLARPGTAGHGTNPEQLLAAGWSACFERAIDRAARTLQITLPAQPSIDAEIDLNEQEGSYFLSARLKISLPGLEREMAQRLVQAAHAICPYSQATRGNIEVALTLA